MLTTPDKYKWRRIGGAAGPKPKPNPPPPPLDHPSVSPTPPLRTVAAAAAAVFQFIKMPEILIYYCHEAAACRNWVSPAHLFT